MSTVKSYQGVLRTADFCTLEQPNSQIPRNASKNGLQTTWNLESLEEARQQDVMRCKSLKRILSAGNNGSAIGRLALLWENRIALDNIARSLEHSVQCETNWPNLASAVYFRTQRMAWMDEVRCNFQKVDNSLLRVFTIVNQNWQYTPEQLAILNPRLLFEQLRQQFYRCGLLEIPGFLLAFLHGEFDPASNFFQLHVHGVTNAERATALHALKENWGYGRTPSGGSAVRVQQVKNRERQLSYLLQSFWPERPTITTASGIVRRVRIKRMLGELQHAIFLLWISKRSVSDLRLCLNCRFNGNHLQLNTQFPT